MPVPGTRQQPHEAMGDGAEGALMDASRRIAKHRSFMSNRPDESDHEEDDLPHSRKRTRTASANDFRDLSRAEKKGDKI